MRLERHARKLPDPPTRRRSGLLLGLFGVLAVAALTLLLVRPTVPPGEEPPTGTAAALTPEDPALLSEAFPSEDDLVAPLGPLDDGLAEADLGDLGDEELEALSEAYAAALDDG
jgi:hypothetical protein